MKISVIVPCLNGDVPRSLPQDDPRIELVVVHGVRPVSAARNEGLRRATGDYVAWVDADDEVTADWLDRICAAVERNVDCVVLDFWRGETPMVWRPSGRGVLADVLIARTLTPPVWRFVTRRSLWEGIWFDETLIASEDFKTMPEVLARVQSVARGGMTYRYVQHPESLVHSQGDAIAWDGLRAARERIERWRGTEFEVYARAESFRVAVWMIRAGLGVNEMRSYLRANGRAILMCRALSPVWKVYAVWRLIF